MATVDTSLICPVCGWNADGFARSVGYWEAKQRMSSHRRWCRLKAARAKATHTKEEWEALRAEVNGECVRCGRRDMRLEKDHIVPLYKGGSDGIDNLQPICAPCNASKGPETINWLSLWRGSLA